MPNRVPNEPSIVIIRKKKIPLECGIADGETRTRTGDTTIFRRGTNCRPKQSKSLHLCEFWSGGIRTDEFVNAAFCAPFGYPDRFQYPSGARPGCAEVAGRWLLMSARSPAGMQAVRRSVTPWRRRSQARSAYRRSVGGSERIESSAEFGLLPIALVGQTPPEARSGVAVVFQGSQHRDDPFRCCDQRSYHG